MSLNWNLSKIENHKELCFVGEGESRKLSNVTEGLIWYTMFCDIGQITDKNWMEFYQRIKLIERLRGSTIYDGEGDELFLKPEQVKAHIGLSTNVSYVSMTKWKNRVVDTFLKEELRKAK